MLFLVLVDERRAGDEVLVRLPGVVLAAVAEPADVPDALAYTRKAGRLGWANFEVDVPSTVTAVSRIAPTG